MKRAVELFSVVILVVALGAVAGGLFGNRSLRPTAAAAAKRGVSRPVAVPEPIVVAHLERVLSGAHSLERGDPDDDPSASVDTIVAARPRGWAAPFAPHLHALSKLALVLLGCGHEPEVERPFIESAIPLSIACDPRSDASAELVDLAHASGKLVLVEFASHDAGDHDARANLEERYLDWHARGLLGTIDDGGGQGADALAAFLAAHHGLAVDAMGHSGALFYRRARARRITALTRDVLADSRDERAYTAFMLGTAAGISRRTGVAIVMIHAKPRTYQEIEKFAVAAPRDDIQLVALDAL